MNVQILHTRGKQEHNKGYAAKILNCKKHFFCGLRSAYWVELDHRAEVVIAVNRAGQAINESCNFCQDLRSKKKQIRKLEMADYIVLFRYYRAHDVWSLG